MQFQINLFLNQFRSKLETKETGLHIFLICKILFTWNLADSQKEIGVGGAEKEGGDRESELFLLNYGIYVSQYLEK